MPNRSKRSAEAQLLPPPLQQVDRTYVLSGRRKRIYFAGCDYFRLSSHPVVLQALGQSVRSTGLSVSASRKTTGNHRVFHELEQALCSFFQSRAAVLAGTGYMTNLIVAQAVQGHFTHALIDERAHPSLQDAALLLGCPVLPFRHRDPAHAASQLHELGPRAVPVLLTDGLFSHDGSIAPIPQYLELLPANGRIIMDEAHAAGVLGEGGRGTLEQLNRSAERIIRTLTLSKAFGVYGGVILCDAPTQKLVLTRSRMFTGHTPMPLPLVEAARVSLRLVHKDGGMRKRLTENAQWVKNELRKAGLQFPDTPAPILPYVPKTTSEATKLKNALLRAGIHPPFIRYPGGPRHGYFRFVLSSEHTLPQLRKLTRCLKTAVQ